MIDRYGEEIEPDDAANAAAASAIAHCEHCDDNGIRLNGLGRCDHVDYGAIAKRGRAAVDAELRKDRS